MNDLKKFIKSTGIYLIGNVLSRILSFLLLPVYTKYLSPQEYGQFDLNVAYITFLSSILFLDIWSGIMRFMFDYKSDSDKAKPITTGSFIFIISTIVYSMAVLILGNIFKVDYIGLLLLYGLTLNIQQLVGYVARAFGRNGVFAVGGLIGSIVIFSVNILLIVEFNFGYESLYIANIVGMIVNFVFVGRKIKFLKNIKISYFDKKIFKELILFSAPLSLNSIAYWFLTSFNRVVISNELTLAENGLYAVGTKFTAIIQLLVTCFQMAWQELTYSKANETKEKMGKFYTTALNEYTKFLLLGITLLLPIIKIVFPFFIGKEYQSAISIIPLAMLATVFSSISSFLGSICGTLKQNKYIFTTTIAGTVVNISIVLLLINSIGVQAANISLLMGFFVVVYRRLVLLNKTVKIFIRKKTMLYLIIIYLGSILIYMYCSTVINIVYLIILVITISWIYRDVIRKILKKI